jgi:hypothetical protein
MTAPRGDEPNPPAREDAAQPARPAEPPRTGGGYLGPMPPAAVPRAGAPKSAVSPSGDPGPGWAAGGRPEEQATTVLPGARPARPAPARPAVRSDARPATGSRPAGGTARPAPGRGRRTRLAMRRIDPWSVFVFSLVASVFLGVALVVAVAALYAVLGSLGVTGSLNQLFAEVTGATVTDTPLLTGGRIIGGAAVLGAINVVLLTLLATLASLLYNLVASFTGGLEVTLGERD